MLDADRIDRLSPIKWTALAKFVDFYQLDGDQTDWLMAVIPIADNIVLQDRRKKATATGGKS